MKRVVIVVEGQTEQEFVKECLGPYFFNKYGIVSVSARLIGTPGHKGGNVKYSRLKSDIDILLNEPNVVVSTFIDFYRLENDFPKYELCNRYAGTIQRIECLEQELASAVSAQRFIPYIQMHEFEAVLYSSEVGFQKYLGEQTCLELQKIINQFSNPEDINGINPPSYRLIDIFEKYEGIKYVKRVYGNILALEIGIEPILARCQRFASWIVQVGELATADK